MENLEGQKFGNLIVKGVCQKHRTPSNRIVYKWSCTCDCGSNHIALANHLKSGKTWRCRKCSYSKPRNPTGNPEWQNNVKYPSGLCQIIANSKWRANNRGNDVKICHQSLWEKYEKQNKICAISGMPIKFASSRKKHSKGETTASLDRIDSTKGYIITNVQWVHKRVNLMKNNLSDCEFIELCRLITKHNEKSS